MTTVQSGPSTFLIQTTENQPPALMARDWLCILLLAVTFFILMRPTLHHPFYWDGGEIAVMSAKLQDGHLKPLIKHYIDEGHPPLIHEVYAAGWMLLGHRAVWWPHLASIALSFLTLLYSYRIGVWLGSRLVGFAAAALIMLDPLYLAQSSNIHIAGPSVGLATATIYYLLTDRPRVFALVASLTALTYIPTTIFTMVMIGAALLLYWRKGRSIASLGWYLVPGVVLVIWLLLHRWSYGYFLSDPAYWASGQRSVLLNTVLLGHIQFNLADVFRHSWRLPFTIIVMVGGVLLVVSMLLRKIEALEPIGALLFERLGSQRAAKLLFILLAGAFGSLPIISAVTGAVLLARYQMILMVPLFVLAVQFLQATKVPAVWVGVCLLLGLNLHSHWYVHKLKSERAMDETLLCRGVVVMEMKASKFLSTRFPDAKILAPYPHEWELADTLFGYVPRPLNIQRAPDYTSHTPVDLIYYSSVGVRTPDVQNLFKAVNELGARPIQRYEFRDLKIVILKTGENVAVPEDQYKGLFINAPLQATSGQHLEVSFGFQNLGRNAWSQEEHSLIYHWERDGKSLPNGNALPYPLEQDYFWGETGLFNLPVVAPAEPGHCDLVVDLLGPRGSFESLGNTPLRIGMEVN